MALSLSIVAVSRTVRARAVRTSAVIGLALCTAQTPAFAAPVVGDYNADGLSDLALAQVNKSTKTTNWSVRLSNGSTQTAQLTLPGDALTPGNFFGGNALIPGVVFVRSLKSPLEWQFAGNSGLSTVNFGRPGDTPVQADYDCDGIIDMAVSRPRSGNKNRWYFRLSSGATAKTIDFAQKGYRVFGADVNGDGCSELVAVRLVGNDIRWYSRKYSSAAVTALNWGLKGDIPLKPMDMNSDGVPDYIVVRPMNGQHLAFVRFNASSSTIVTVGSSDTIPLTGNFTGQNGFAYYDRDNKVFFVKNQDGTESLVNFGLKNAALIRPDGSVVQPNQSERFGSAPGGGSNECDKTLSNNDGSGGFVNNPDNSRGTMKFVLPNSFTGNTSGVKVVKDGKLIDTFYNAAGNEWGNRERYYGRKSLGSYPNDLTGIITKKDGTNYCVSIPIPSKRYD